MPRGPSPDTENPTRHITKMNVKALKKVLTAYNKSQRKGLFKNVSNMKRTQLEAAIRTKFRLIHKGPRKVQVKYVSGRFTKVIPY